MFTPIISFYWNNSKDFLNFDNTILKVSAKGKKTSFSYSSLVSIKFASKKKLAPLVIGAILASLALVNILLKGAGLSMVGLSSIGLLILYFGMSEYWVITIEQFTESNSIWISKNKCPLFPKTLINIINYKISKGFFPPMYTRVNRSKLENIIADTTSIIELKEPLRYFLTPPKQNPLYLLLKVDLSKINHSLICVVNQDYLAIGKYQLNKDALLNIEI